MSIGTRHCRGVAHVRVRDGANRGLAVCEVLLERDVRAPDLLSRPAVNRGYLLRRCKSVCGLLCIDIGSLCLAVAFAHLVLSQAHGTARAFQPIQFAVLAAALVAVFAVHRLYGLRASRGSRRRQLKAGLWVLAAALVLNGIATVWVPLDVLVVWLTATCLLMTGRAVYDLCLKAAFGVDPESKRVIVLGSETSFCDFKRKLSVRPGLTLVGIVGDMVSAGDRRRGPDSGIPSLGSLADIEAIVQRARPDELLVVDREVESGHLVELAAVCRRQRLVLKLADLEMRFSESGVSLVPGLGEALFVSPSSAQSGAAWLFKRGLDVVVALVLLVLCSPLLLLIAVAVKLTSSGPVFYAAPRVGLGQRQFSCYKFRTMRADAADLQAQLEARNEADGAIFKIRDDPRVTPLGRWLRALSLDELPQLVNVLCGDMSLVGPRPLPLRDNELLAAWHKQRHVVLPGMTGLWQVNGRSERSFADMIRLDLRYIDSWSIWLDLAILLRTVRVVVSSRGAC